jgi:hypothetical protein
VGRNAAGIVANCGMIEAKAMAEIPVFLEISLFYGPNASSRPRERSEKINQSYV